MSTSIETEARRTNALRSTQTRSTLEKQFGPAFEATENSLLFELGESGDGIILVRTAVLDDVGVLIGQARLAMTRMKAAGFEPRRLLVVGPGPGNTPLEARPDLIWLLAEAESDWCRAVGCVDYHRLSRNLCVLERVTRALLRSSVRVITADPGRADMAGLLAEIRLGMPTGDPRC